MRAVLRLEGVKHIVRKVRASVSRKECWSCDCFQGFLTQLEIDMGEQAAEFTKPFKVPLSEMHQCLGCDPCPPGQMFAQYLKGRQECCKPGMEACVIGRRKKAVSANGEPKEYWAR